MNTALAHVPGTDAARVSREARLGSTKPASTYQLAKLALGRKRAAMAGRSARADKRLRRF